MAERFLFFNSTTGDPRKYQAQDFAEYFGSILSTGLLHTDKIPGMFVKVEAGTLNTIASPGKAVMRGHLYENTTDLALNHSLPEPDLDRIDRVVLRLNLQNAERNIKLRVVSGEPSANPVAPELTRTQFIHEISLAQIRIKANTVQLQQSDLIDERLKEDLCGLVSSLLSIPTSQFQDQWDLFFATKSAELQAATDDYESHVISRKQAVLDDANQFAQMVIASESELQGKLTGFEAQWNDWFSQQQTQGYLMASEKGAVGGVASQDDFTEYKSDLVSQEVAKGASLIGVHDAGNLFSATTVEGALKEAITQANSAFTSASNGKSAVSAAITGVDPTVVIPPEPTFPQLAATIGQISTGKKWASGYSERSSLDVKNLLFNPFMVVIIGNNQFAVLNKTQTTTNGYVFYYANGGNYRSNVGSITGNSFKMEMHYGMVTWYAFE